MILTTDNGAPIARPIRADFATDVDFIRAYHAYRDRIAAVANAGFVCGFTPTKKK